MATAKSSDVLIIGGGPAGSTAASFLAMKGYRVTLFEKERFPRHHVGESLLPFCHPLFRDLGVLEEMEGCFVRKPGVRFISREGEFSTTWCFDRVIEDDSHLSFQVERARFDALLLENARRHGAVVHEETRVVGLETAPSPTGPDRPAVRLEAVDGRGVESAHEARFVLDASGRETFIGSQMRARRLNRGLERTALWTHYSDVELAGGLEEGLSLIVYLGGDRKGWAWLFPLARNRVTVGFVTDNAYLRRARGRYRGRREENWRVDLFERELRRAPLVRELLEGARRCLPLFVNADYSYEVDAKYGDHYALIGDAGRFIDPIFSSGVFLAMKSARLVAEALDELFDAAPGVKPSPLAAAYEMIDGAYEVVAGMVGLFYDPHALSWAELGATGIEPEEGIAGSHGIAMAAGHYLLAGDFFERHGKYLDLLRLLRKPRTFAQYKSMVIDREEFADSTCRRGGSVDPFPEPRSGGPRRS